MKNIGSVKEDLSAEKRISITPETVKQFVDLNFSILLEKSYGEHIGIPDDKYKNVGVTFCDSAKEVLERSEQFNSAPYGGFINPHYSIVKNEESGEITDVLIEYPDDFTNQMMGYAKNYSFLPNIN